jgi:hypothetical protein
VRSDGVLPAASIFGLEEQTAQEDPGTYMPLK